MSNETAILSKSPWNNNEEIDSGVGHACLSNLIIYTEDLADEKKLTETVADYVVKHPCRVILILAQPRSPQPRLEASIAPHTYNRDGRSITCDQITLKACGAASIKELASAVQPLLVPDLPINVWWRGVFLNQRLLVEQILSFTDRFIYDGSTWTNLHYTVMQVADVISKYQDKVGFTNFNWSRLRPWRDCTADFFDRGVFEQDLWNIRKARIEFMALPECEEGYQFRALLFASWLAVQLEWTPVRGMPGMDLAQLQFTDKKGALVDVELVLLPQSSALGQSIQRIELTSEMDAEIRTFSVERDHQERLMILNCTKAGVPSCLRKAPHADSSTADLLHRELGRRVRNRVFERSFQMASELLQLI